MARGLKYGAMLIPVIAIWAAVHLTILAASPTQSEPTIPVRYTDVRQPAKITFQQDSTETEEKYYLETMGTGVAWIDYDQDGLMDLFFVQSAATDIYKPPHPLRCALYHNNGDGTFSDVTDKAGGGEGHYGQGVAVGDFDNDGFPDLYVTGYGRAILYHNNGNGTFTDETYRSGLGNKAVLMSGVAMKFLDYDNDGWNDILQLNGAMLENVALYHAEVRYKEPLLMFRNLGKGQFDKVSESLGPDFMRPVAGRGLATADYDNDGDIVIVTNNRGDFPSLLRNDGGNANHWITVQLIGTKLNHNGIGASLKLTCEGLVHVEQAKGGTGYMSASDPRIHFGLGKRTKIESLEVTWPSGQIDRLANLPIDQIVTVKEGTGIVPRSFPKIPVAK